MNTANVKMQKFPEPRLQHDDAGDMERFLLQQAAELDGRTLAGPAGQSASAD